MRPNGLTAEDSATLALLKVLSGSLRFNILILLRSRPNGMTVGEIAETLNGSTSRISHQLSILKKIGLVSSEGLDHQVRYMIDCERTKRILGAFCREHGAA